MYDVFLDLINHQAFVSQSLLPLTVVDKYFNVRLNFVSVALDHCDTILLVDSATKFSVHVRHSSDSSIRC